MKLSQKLYIGLVIVLLGIITFQYCSRKPIIISKTTKTITIPGDKVPYEVKVPVPIPYRVDSTIHDTSYLAQKVDTAEILRRFFSSYFYLDTVKIDSSFLAVLKETISQNRIKERKIWIQNLRPQSITYNTTIIQQPPSWYYGGRVASGQHIGIGPKVLYIKGKNAFDGDIDFVNKTIGISYSRSF